LGNKIDLEDEREVPESKIKSFLKANNTVFYEETSAKQGTNIEKVFY
jgi:GTPase SAR1 family protein